MMNEYNNKHSAIKGLMKNEKISGIIKDALNSPIGSTSRKRAQNIISVLRKANLVDGAGGAGYAMYDGAGGPGYTQPTATSTPSDYSRMVVFPSAPPMSGVGSPGDQNWQPGLIERGISSTANWITKKAIPGVEHAALSGLAGTLGGAETFGGKIVHGAERAKESLFGFNPSDPNAAWNKPTPTFGGSFGGQAYAGLNAPSAQTPQVPQAQTPPSTPSKMTPASTPPQPSTPPATPIANVVSYKDNPDGTTTNFLSDGTTSTVRYTQNPDGSLHPTEVPTSTPSGTPTAPKYPSVQDAVNAGIGPSMFALQTLSDPQRFRETMKSTLGIDIPDDQLPQGATLSENINNLSDALKGQWKLDELLNKKNDMIENGVTVERDLNDYIRGRDEYLNQTEGAINSFKEKMSGMDLGNPAVAKQADNYMNYLYTLRGRQSQRYMDFVNSSIDVYNKNLTEISNNYDKALAGYQFDLQKKSAVTQEEYQMYSNALSEMYTNVEEAPAKRLQMQALKSQLTQTALSGVSDATKNLLDSTNYQKGLNALKNVPESVQIADKDGALVEGAMPIREAMDKFGVGKDGVPPVAVKDFYLGAMTKQIGTATSLDHVVNFAKQDMGMISDFMNNATDQATYGMAADMLNTVSDKISSAVRTTISKDPRASATVANAVSTITQKPFFGKNQVMARADFLKKYKGQLPDDVLNLIYTRISEASGNFSSGYNPNVLVDVNGVAKRFKDFKPDDYAWWLGDIIAPTMSAGTI